MPKSLPDDPRFEALLDYIKKSRGFDFTGYKRSSLVRRVRKRMIEINAEQYSDYIDYLEVHPQEFDLLFNTVLINVTSFFRDSYAWNFLNNEIIPRLLESSDKIRIWSAGCATGQEAYSIAMLLCEALGEQGLHNRVKIYATDIDDDALLAARQASYESRTLEDLPSHLRERYFIKTGEVETFRSDIRRLVIFGRHDLVQDAPIPKLDLLICRNTLMYLNADTQARILARMHFALKPDGYLFLGRAEMLLSHTNLFNPVDLQHRVFSKVSKLNLRERLLVMSQANDSDGGLHIDQLNRLKEMSFEKSHLSQLVVDEKGVLTLANANARELFGLGQSELGKNLKDIELSYRPIEMRSMIEQCMLERRPIKIEKIVVPKQFGAVEYLQCQLSPLLCDERLLGVSIIFDNATDFYTLYDHLRSAHEDLETTNEELESTNEELETTNEELQSTNEELETTNEELQSTNEELETTNAELQATNEELESTNYELRSLTIEVEQINAFLENVLTSLDHGIAVLDKKGTVKIWNKQCEEFWGLRSDEVVGKSLFALDIGLPVEEVREGLAREQYNNQQFVELELKSVNRRGRSFTCLVRATPLKGRGQDGGTVLLFDATTV